MFPVYLVLVEKFSEILNAMLTKITKDEKGYSLIHKDRLLVVALRLSHSSLIVGQ